MVGGLLLLNEQLLDTTQPLLVIGQLLTTHSAVHSTRQAHSLSWLPLKLSHVCDWIEAARATQEQLDNPPK